MDIPWTARTQPALRLRSRVSPYALVAGSVIFLAFVTQAFNMFAFPSYFQDEGTYQSQAWALWAKGELAPYTYWYDHPPAGWIFSGLWMELTGGFHTFGSSLDTGRVFILLLHVASVYMLFWITRRITGSTTAGVVAALLFMLSPFRLLEGRRLMLEPIAIFWMLCAIVPLLSERSKLTSYWLSAIFFGLAVLTKEVFVVFTPGMILLAWLRADPAHRGIAMTHWSALCASLVSFYPVYAVLKGELFPTGWPLAAGGEHVSLIGTMKFHMAEREQDAGIIDLHSRFWDRPFHYWLDLDPFLTVATAFAIVAALLLGFKYRPLWPMAIFIGLFVLFLGRGGVVFEFYALPLVPLVSLVVAVALREIVVSLAALVPRRQLKDSMPATRTFGSKLLHGALALLLTVGLAVPVVVATMHADSYKRWYDAIYTSDNTWPQHQAVDWIKKNAPSGSLVVMDAHALLEVPGFEGNSPREADQALTVHWYWKVERDPEIRDRILHRDWRRVDYMVVAPNMEVEAGSGIIPFVAEIMSHGKTVAYFERDGYWMKILRIVHRSSTQSDLAMNGGAWP